MKHFLIRVAQRLLALSFLSASLAAAESAPEMIAAREAAAWVMPKLQAGSWQASEPALHTINELATSQEQADKDLAEKLTGLFAAAIEQGINQLPPPPEQERLLRDAGDFVDLLLNKPTTIHRQRARSVIAAWEKVLPDHLKVRVLRLGLSKVEKNREAQIKQSAALMTEDVPDQNVREWARELHVDALLSGTPSADDIQQAEAVVTPWLEKEPKNTRARLLLLNIHHARHDSQAQYALATELLADETLSVQQRKQVQMHRLHGALQSGRANELNQQDWDFMLEQFLGSNSGLKRLIDEHGPLLLAIAFGIGWAWLFIVAFITRCVRTNTPGFWMVVLWATIILYASTVIMAPLAHRITFSLLGLVFLIFATTGSKAPLGYLVTPQAATESGKARWRSILGWCVLALLLINLFTQGYALAFERVMGRQLESQFVAKLLQTDTLPKLIGMVLAGGIFVPFLEEVIFRGIMQDWVGRWLPAGWCVLIVSILFGLIHGLEMAIPIAFIGVLLSLLRLRYRSLWPCILLHSLNNSVMIVLLYFIPEKLL